MLPNPLDMFIKTGFSDLIRKGMKCCVTSIGPTTLVSMVSMKFFGFTVSGVSFPVDF